MKTEREIRDRIELVRSRIRESREVDEKFGYVMELVTLRWVLDSGDLNGVAGRG